MPTHSTGFRILSLDGGWVRGLSTLYILQDLMDRIRVQNNLNKSPLPRDYFDLIVGTSSGGIIALMLGRLRMPVNDAIDVYRELCQDIFTESFKNILHPLSSKPKPRYSAERLEDATIKFAKDASLTDPDPTACKVAVVAIKQRAASDMPDLLRTYESSSGRVECTISDAARATTAATGFFKPAVVKIKHGLEVIYLDGSLGHNNPTDLAVEEARGIWGTEAKFKCIVSIGTGMEPNVNYKGTKLNLEHIQQSSRKVHSDMENQFGRKEGVYFRFDVETDLVSVGLDDWKRSGEIGDFTHAYVRRESVKFRECVDALTGKKRAGVGDGLRVMHQSSEYDGLRGRIREWLSPPDPSTNHIAARDKHTSGTGEWLLNGDEYKEWKERVDSFLWVNSLPGGGKTFLCSTVIEDVKIACYNASAAIGYFYFDFSDPRKLKFRSVLHSLVTQLCFQSAGVPSSLAALYSRNHDGGHQPTIKDLSETFEDMIGHFDHVYIVLDALDECESGEQAALLDFVETVVAQKFGRLHLLITSRRLPNIEEALTPLVNGHISPEVAVNEDIQIYIRDILMNDRSLKGFKEIDKETILRELTYRSNGMFKWVECQLVELRQCFNSATLRETLENLPESLDETYIRILRRIPKRGSKFASKVLQFLAFGARPMSIEELAEVVIIDPDSEDIIVSSNRLRNPEQVLNICPGLLTISLEGKGEVVKLSHFSVKEYLVSDRIKTAGPLDIRCYSLNAISTNKFIGQICLVYLLLFDKADSLDDNTFRDFPLARYAAEYWIYHVRFDDSITGMLQDLVKKLLQPCIEFYNWVRLHDIDAYWRPSFLERTTDSIAPPVYYSSLAGLYEQSKWLLKNGVDVNAGGGECGSALGAASSRGNEGLVRLLLEHGADVNVRGGEYGSPLVVASSRGHEGLVRLLLESGADVNGGGGIYDSALEAASFEGHNGLVRLLLEKGADVSNMNRKKQCMAPRARRVDLEALEAAGTRSSDLIYSS